MRGLQNSVLAMGLFLFVVGCADSAASSVTAPGFSVNVIYTGSSSNFNDVSFSPGGIGYAVGNYGAVLRSTDQGKTWQRMPSGIRPTLRSVSVPDDNTVLATSIVVYRSSDRGATWTIAAFEEEHGPSIFGMYFVSDRVGFLTEGDHIYRSSDVGSTWQLVGNGPLCSMFSFPDPMIGYCAGGHTSIPIVAGSPYLTGGDVVKTVDGGNTWKSLGLLSTLHMAQITGIQFLSPSVGFIFTVKHEMFKTLDGGANWSLVSNSVPGIHASPFFADESTGVVATVQPDGIYQTTNGGTTWEIVFAAPAPINGLAPVNKTTAVFFGNQGLLGTVFLHRD